MCPICWATALATFGGLLTITVLSIAATDFWTIAAATVLGATLIVHRVGIGLMPWWVFAMLASIAIVRVAYLLVFCRDRLLVVKVWGHARQMAARRCPKPEPGRPTSLNQQEGGP